MQLKDREPLEGGRERVTVVPESVDDLWHLQYVLENPDYGTAQRLASEVVVLPVHQHIDPRTILDVANAIDRRIG